jgi:hypothetical protein
MNLNFLFKSSDHFRYENGIHVSGPHGGARRAVKVEPNKIDEESYTVTIYNLDGDHPIWQKNIQMAPKQMKIIEQSNDKIVLRGFGQDNTGASFADYGLTINYLNGQINKCYLHLYDRQIIIEYLKEEEIQSDKEYLPIHLGLLQYAGKEDPVEFIQSQINKGILVSPAKYDKALFIVERHKDDNLIDRYNYFATEEYIIHLLDDIKKAIEKGSYSNSIRNEFLSLKEIISNGLIMTNSVGIKELIDFGNALECESFYSNVFKK